MTLLEIQKATVLQLLKCSHIFYTVTPLQVPAIGEAIFEDEALPYDGDHKQFFKITKMYFRERDPPKFFQYQNRRFSA